MKKNDAPDYTAVLADLRARRAQLDAAIQALEAVVGSPAAATRSPPPQERPPGTRALPKSFVGLSVLDAAKQHLQRTGHSLRTTEILGALQQGGVALTGKSPINSLGAILNSNLRKDAGIVRERRGVWALAAWHASRPEAMNGSLAIGLERLLGGVPPPDRHGPTASPSILMPSPPTAAALHA
jgi:hypothetical protein